jgi:hypothetical protein
MKHVQQILGRHIAGGAHSVGAAPEPSHGTHSPVPDHRCRENDPPGDSWGPAPRRLREAP